jgi:two-component system sensor histidine kinase KdpD
MFARCAARGGSKMTAGRPAGDPRMSNRDSAFRTRDRATPARKRAWTRAKPFVTATFFVAVAAGIAPLLQRLPHANLSLLFLTGVLIVAVRYGLWPSIYASILSFFVFTFFFTSPYMTFSIREEGDVATLVFFLVMASITGNLASRLRDAMAKREAAMHRTALLLKDLEQANIVSEREQLRSALLTSVSHDLRTPLSSIIGAASSLLAYERSLSGKDKNILLQSVLDEAERLDRYIQNLLDMMRLGQGQLELHRDWQDLRDLVSTASRRLRLSARGFGLDTDISGDAELIYVHGDLIEQVLVNLFDNAARYSPEGGRIRLRATRNNDDVVIDVADQGPGIPEADRERVFDPFYRVHERDRKSGTGLGLSICRGILRAHGGDAAAFPPAGDIGALLRLRIPQGDAPEPPR